MPSQVATQTAQAVPELRKRRQATSSSTTYLCRFISVLRGLHVAAGWKESLWGPTHGLHVYHPQLCLSGWLLGDVVIIQSKINFAF